MALPALPAEGSTSWYTHYAAVDEQVRFYCGQERRNLDSFAGATPSAKFRQAIIDDTGVFVLVPAGTTLDAQTTPFTLPTGFSFGAAPAIESMEFGYTGTINVRHTGGSAVFAHAAGSKGQTISGVTFKGLTSTNLFVDNTPWEYVTFRDVSVMGMNKILSVAYTGFRWIGACSLNTFSADAIPITLSGSDGSIFEAGCFWEMGSPGGATTATYNKKAALAAMISLGSLSKTRIGGIYITGSCTTPFRLTGGSGGITLSDTILEGRPTYANGDNPLWCAGELGRLTGGASTIRARWHGYAMADPAATGRSPGGFYVVTGGSHLIDGGTWQPYTTGSGVYAWNGNVLPRFARVTGGTLQVKGITLGPNAGSTKPVISTSNAAFVDVDNSCTVVVE